MGKRTLRGRKGEIWWASPDRQKPEVACYNGCGYTPAMVLELKLRKIGNSVGLVLPKEALSKLRVEEGDTITLTESALGYQMSGTDPEFTRAMDVFQDLAQRYRNTLAELAK